MKSPPPFQRLVRFIDSDNIERYGDVPVDVNITEIESGKVSAVVLVGNVKDGLKRTTTQKVVKKVRILKRLSCQKRADLRSSCYVQCQMLR